ncbi:metalloregulator ArsR/SmtB family transcription factor [Altererythrobacter sp. GH1-8]|uniref:metalloregulator ArsR/SmtB family transcription factor n=1 Tax=Altererythrobacter sp. GH1-8 TaxID=3349333 RepID=UPI00374CE852
MAIAIGAAEAAAANNPVLPLGIGFESDLSEHIRCSKNHLTYHLIIYALWKVFKQPLICPLMQKVFEALSSTVRRKILAYLSETDLTAGEIADRFEISKPAVSQHLGILENAGLVESEKRGQYVHYRLVRENLANTLNSYVQEVCPVARPLKRESKALGKTE